MIFLLSDVEQSRLDGSLSCLIFYLQITQSQSGKGTWSHSSPATGCVGLGNQPDRLATSLAAPMLPWMSLMDDAEI